MTSTTPFSLEGTPVEIKAFEGSTPYKCNLCFYQTCKGHSLLHKTGNELVFCNSCFAELKLAIAFIVVQEGEHN
ncbi:MAG: hypothetical protein ACFE9L_09220 [Candidatus Hodarchaeota archaeon]